MATLCLHAICPYGYGTHVHGSWTHTPGPRTCSLRAMRVKNLLQPFSRHMTVPQVARLKVKCERFMVKLFKVN